MSRRHELIYALNAGGVDEDALARIDLEKMRLAGEHPVPNWLPSVLGPMSIRPGLGYRSRIAGDALTRTVPFIVSSSKGYQLGFSDLALTIYNDGVAATVSAPSSTITNPTFTNGGGGWSDVSDTGPGDDGTATLSSQLILVATKWRVAAAEQTVTIAGGDQSTLHTLAIDVTRGPVFFRVGSSSGAEDVVGETRLLTGYHKLTFTPGVGTIYIRLRSDDPVQRLVSRCIFEHTALGGAGVLVLPTPWAEDDLYCLSFDQSADVLFVADGVQQPRRIERRGDTSWSVTLYDTKNGPWRSPEFGAITLTPSAYKGNGTLTASGAYFKPSHVGTLFELTQDEQLVTDQLDGADQCTEKITVNGLWRDASGGGPSFSDRDFTYNVVSATGSFDGTIALQRSLDSDALIWSDVLTVTSGSSQGWDGAATYNDRQSNLTAHYRLKVKDYTSGYAIVSLSYSNGSQTGQVRITGYTNSTTVSYEAINSLGGTKPTRVWRGPAWSDDLGWPSVPRFFDARLWWFRADTAYGAIVDDYPNYDDTTEGDSGPVIRSIGAGAIEGAQWALDMQRLIVGTTGYEASIRSSSFDEPITPTKFTSRNASTLGCSKVPGQKVDRGAFFVQRSGRRLYEMLFSVETQDYTSQDATRINPHALDAVVKSMAVQRNPDTRNYIVLQDGSCVVLTWERDDKVYAYTTLIPAGGGLIEDVVVTPSSAQDSVYFIVNRGGARYLERLAVERDQRSKATCALLDAHVVLTGPVSFIAGATHLAGQTVQIWADGQRRGDVTLDGSGNGALDGTYDRVVYGLSYAAAFKSVKLAYAAQLGSAIGQPKRIARAGILLRNSCLDGIRIGKDESYTDPLPTIVNGAVRAPGQFFLSYDHEMHPVPSQWDSDSRIYVSADSAYGPVTVQAIAIDVETREAVSPPKSNQQ